MATRLTNKLILLAVTGVFILSGCATKPIIDISGSEFVQKVEQRKPGQKIVLRRTKRAGYFYVDWYVMPPTQSMFVLDKTFRTSTNELSAERFEALKEKVAEQDAKNPFPPSWR